MTTQTYHTDDDHLAQEHDHLVPEDNLMEPDADLAVAEASQTEPDADLAVAEAPPTEHEDLTSDAADATALADLESSTSIVPDDPGFTPDGDDAAEGPGLADGSPANLSMVSVAFTAPASVSDSQLAVSAVSARGPWNEVQAMFVDDPRASIERAAGLVDDRVEALIQSLRERQRSMQSAWWADDAGTEELRVALQHYRTFWNSLDDLPAQT